MMMNSLGSGDAPISSREKFKSSLPKPKSFIPSFKKLTLNNANGKPVEKCTVSSVKMLSPPENVEDLTNEPWKSKIGCHVSLAGVKHGILKFYGETAFAEGYWCGIQLDEPVGKNDGTKDGVKYFSCPENHGIFAPPSKVFFVNSPEEKPADQKILNNNKEVLDSDKSSFLITSKVSSEKELSKASDEILFSESEKGNIQSNEKNCLQSRLKPPKILRKNRGIPVFNSKSPVIQSNIVETHSNTFVVDDTSVLKAQKKIANELVPSSAPYNSTRSKLTCDSKLNQTVTKKTKSETSLEIGDGSTYFHSGNLDAYDKDMQDTDCKMNSDFEGNATFVLNSSVKEESDINVTYVIKQNDLMNSTDFSPFNLFQNDIHKSNSHENKTFELEPNKSLEDMDFVKEEIPNSVELENESTLTILSNSNNTEDICYSDLLQEEYDSEDVDDYGRQGSFEFDESLGILTPNQIKDFTLFAENSLMKTPSIEDVQELNDEMVEDFNQELSFKQEIDDEYGISKGLDNFNEIFTSTPFQNKEYLSSTESGILDISYPAVNDSISYFHLTQFEKRKQSTNEVMNSPNLSMSSAVQDENLLDIKKISNLEKSDVTHSVLNGQTMDNNNSVQDLCLKKSENLLPASNILEIAMKNLNGKEIHYQEKLKNTKQSFNEIIDINKKDSKSDAIYLKESNRHIHDVVEKLLQGVMSESMNEVVATCLIPEKTSIKQAQNLPQIHTSKDEVITDYLVHQMGQNFSENLLEKKERPFSSLTVSVTSIDTGYQGDAEGDVPSATASALNTPVEEQRKIFGANDNLSTYLNDAVCILRHPKVDVGSDSDFCSDMGTSWTESEMENEEKIRGRSARVIDGKLYYSTDEMEQLTIDVEKEKIDEIICNKENSVSKEIECEINEESPLKTNDLSQTMQDQISVIENDVSSESSATIDVGSSLSNTETIASQEIKNHSSEKENKQVDDNSIENASDLVTPMIEEQTKDAFQEKADTKVKPNNKSLQNNGQPINHFLSPETSKKPLKKDDSSNLKKFKPPKKNVVSKIKAMIESSSKSTPSSEEKIEQAKKSRMPKKSRWDAVMSKIAAGQAEEKAKAKIKKEIKSRVDTNLSGSKTPIKLSFEKRPSLKSTVNHPFTREHTGCSDVVPCGVDGEGSLISSNHSSRSDLSFSQPSVSKTQSKSKLPRRPRSDRPVSPSQLSDASTLSATSHLSVYSQTSQMSCALNKSNASLNSISSAHKTKDTSLNRPKPATIKPNKKSPGYVQPLSSTTVQTAGNRKSQPNPNIHHAINSKSPIKATNTQRVSKPTITPRASAAQTPSNRLAKEQVRLRNVKNQPTVSKPSLQTDVLNSASLTRTTLIKEKARLENLCEKHLKEKHLMKTYIEQKNRDLEALAMVLRYMNEELNAFSLPSLKLKLEHLNDELHESWNSLDQAHLDKKDLHEKIENLTTSQQEAIKKLKVTHAEELEKLKESLQKTHIEEVAKLNEKFQNLEEERKGAFICELEDLKVQHEKNLQELEERNNQQILDLEAKHKTEIEDLQMKFSECLKEEENKLNSIQAELKEKIGTLTVKNEELKRKNKEVEENLLKDSDFKMQMAAAKIKDLEKEVDSLKTVMELRNKEIHDLRQDSNFLKKLKEELHIAEEKIAVLSARTEDLQAQINIKSTTERQMSSEHQLLKEWYEKKSKINKRLSMENEELQWRLQQSLEGSFFLLSNGSPDYHSWDENVKKTMDNAEMTTPRKYYLDPSAATPSTSGSSSSSKVKSNPVQIRDPHGRHQRLSVSDIESKHKSDISPAIRYRRAGSLSWTVGIDPHETIDSPDSSSPFDQKHTPSSDSTEESTEPMDECKSSRSKSDFKCEDKVEGNNLSSSDPFQLSEFNFSESEFMTKSVASYNSTFSVGSESESDIIDDKEHCRFVHQIERQHSSSSSRAGEDRVPSLITIKKLEEGKDKCSRHSELSKTALKTKHKFPKQSSPDVLCNTSAIGETNSSLNEEQQKVISDILSLTCNIADTNEDLKKEIAQDKLGHEIISVVSNVDNEILTSQFHIHEAEISKSKNGCELNNRDTKHPALSTGCDLPAVELDFSSIDHGETSLDENEKESKPVALRTRSSMVDAIELDYSARCLTNLEESQHSSITDSNILEEAISESHNSSDFEIISETEDTTNARSSSPKWDSISDIEHSPVHSKRSDSSSGILNSTTVIGLKSPTDSSPLQEPLGMSNSSGSSSSSSRESSPRDSPLFKIRDNEVESMEDSPCSFAMSPRTSAGEAMVLVALPASHHDQIRENSSTLLRRTLHDQFIHDNALNCVDASGKDESSEETSQIYFSKPATPESSSQAVAPTDSTNIDLSWSDDDDDDDIPSETEV